MTVGGMTITDLTFHPSLELLDAGPRSLLVSYRPTSLNDIQWAEVRPQAVALVARAAPKSAAHARVLLSNLCRLLATFAGEVEVLSVDALMTEVNVTRLVGSDERHGMPRSTRSSRRGALRRLLRTQLDLPAYGTRSSTGPRALNPYSVEEMHAILASTAAAPAAMRDVIVSALVLAVTSGLVLSTVAAAELGHLARPCLFSPGARKLLPFLDDGDFARVAPYSKAQWSTTRKWLVSRSLTPLMAGRLRDTWVLRQQQEADADGTPVELIVSVGSISGVLERLALNAAPVGPERYGRLLRDS